MSATGPLSGATFADDSTVGTIAISNAGNAAASDDAYATMVLTLAAVSHFLKATNFGFGIPSDATINGILVEIERSSTLLSATQDSSVKLVKGGVIGGTEKAAAGTWPTTDAYASYGSATDLWGQAWTPADVNLSTFGMAIAASAALAATGQIDHMRITVYWTGSNKSASLAGNKRINAGGMGQPDFIS